MPEDSRLRLLLEEIAAENPGGPRISKLRRQLLQAGGDDPTHVRG